MAIAERPAAGNPTKASWQRDLSVSHNKVGNVLRAQGDAAGALRAYRGALAIAERLAASDPTNASWQRDLSVSHNKVGDVLLAQGDAAGALRAYRATHAILERLAASDPTNASWQRDLWVSHQKVAIALDAMGKAEAKDSWRRAYETLAGMKRKGLFLSPQDEGFLEQLRKKVGER